MGTEENVYVSLLGEMSKIRAETDLKKYIYYMFGAVQHFPSAYHNQSRWKTY